MNTFSTRAVRALSNTLLCLGLAACGETEKEVVTLDPVAFHDGDECHVCGMIITEFPGPKGQAVEKNGVRKFCSTAEMFGWWLQPENLHLDATLYVHDMSDTDWNHPDDAKLIDARTAWYVSGIDVPVAMGGVLATFADEQAAHALAREKQGRVLRFEDISQALLQDIASSGMRHDMPDMHSHGHSHH